MLHIKIDNIPYLVSPQISILEACKATGILLPRFCYHETLSVSGNCRMCLVEVEGLEKPVASCVTEVDEGMSIWLNSPFVQKARENVIETLLVNHPLDCPICDQAGECDLQDQVKLFGGNLSRFFKKKSAVEDKAFGPLIKTIMSRCIKCTRCVRFSTEIAGVDFFGTLNRGGGTEIGAYVSRNFQSEISGNVIDLCPVGALTAKPYAFEGRPWESRLIESVDTNDSLGSSTYVDYNGLSVNRVLPRTTINFKNGFISDKTRFSFDANLVNRLNDVFSFNSETGFKIINWETLISTFTYFIKNTKVEFLVDDKCDFESLVTLKALKNKYASTVQINSVANVVNTSNLYVSENFNVSTELSSSEDAIVLVGANLRIENSILNTFLRMHYFNSLINVTSLSSNFNENLPTTFLYLNIEKALTIFEGKSKDFSKMLFFAQTPLILIGDNVAARVDSITNFINNLKSILPDANILFLKNNINSEGTHFLNIKQINSYNRRYSVGVNLDDNLDVRRRLNSKNKLMAFATHGSSLLSKFLYVAPLSTPFEAKYIYMTLEARFQYTQKSVASYFNAKKFNSFLNACFDMTSVTEKKINFFTHFLEQMSNSDLTSSLHSNLTSSLILNLTDKYKYPVLISKYFVKQNMKDFYCSNTFTKNSVTMIECKTEYVNTFTNFYTKRG